MNITKLTVGIVAMTCISYIGCTKEAKAATLEEVTSLMSAFGTMKIRVINTRKIVFWDAQANTTAHCWKFFVPNNVTTPTTGQGFYAHQWTMSATSAVLTEEQCYAQP